MPDEPIGTMLYDCMPPFALDPRSPRQEVIRSSAPIHDADRCNDGCGPARLYDNGHGGPSEAPGIKSRGCNKYRFQDSIASRDQQVPMWNIRRGCQPFFEQPGIMTRQQPSAENQMTGKQQYDEPRGRPIDASSYTEEHTTESRQLHDAPHKAL
jgi:hypothetical protein